MKKLAIVLGTILYIAVPIDVCPDFLPILGLGDDLVVIVMAVRAVLFK